MVINLAGAIADTCASAAAFINDSFLIPPATPTGCSSGQTFVDEDNTSGCDDTCGLGGDPLHLIVAIDWILSATETTVIVSVSRCDDEFQVVTYTRTGLSNPRDCKAITLTGADVVSTNTGVNGTPADITNLTITLS
jgi:hypothetical protein